MSERFAALADQLRAALADARQRALLGMLMVLLLLQLVLSLMDANDAARVELEELQMTRLRAEALAEAAKDQDVSAAASAAMEETLAFAYQGPTFALAQLKAEQSIQALASEAGIRGVSVQSAPELIGEGTIRFLIVRVEGRLDWPANLSFLRKLAEAEKGARVEGFALARGAARQFRLEIAVPLAETSGGAV